MKLSGREGVILGAAGPGKNMSLRGRMTGSCILTSHQLNRFNQTNYTGAMDGPSVRLPVCVSITRLAQSTRTVCYVGTTVMMMVADSPPREG